jgi:hypothetical protein
MPQTAKGDEPGRRTRPVQVAKRKQKPLGQDEIVVRKKSKTTKAPTDEGDETLNVLDEQKEPKPFISPEKYLDKEIMDEIEHPKEFLSPLKYMYLDNKGVERSRVGSKSHKRKRGCPGGRGAEQSSTQPSEDNTGPVNHQKPVEKATSSPTDRFVTEAQEELMRMIDERASDQAIDNQLKIIKMLRARLPPQGESVFLLSVDAFLLTVAIEEPRRASAQNHLYKKNTQDKNRIKAPNKDIPEPPKPAFASRHPLSISSDSSSSDSNFLSPPTPSPAPTKRPSRTSNAKAKTMREAKELLKTAHPASAPTSLPATQRTNKSLTTKEVANLSKTHPTFDENETHKFDRHTRKINGTRGMASDRPAIPERGLESRIRAPTSSPGESPRRSSAYRLDAAALRVIDSAADSGGREWAGGNFASINQPTKDKSTTTAQPAKGKFNTSLKELEESVWKMNASLGARQMPSGSAAAAAGGQNEQVRRPGQAFNAETKRWQYVEEVDSDND